MDGRLRLKHICHTSDLFMTLLHGHPIDHLSLSKIFPLVLLPFWLKHHHEGYNTLREPRISVVVPHYNDLINLDLCLGALEAQTVDRDDFEIVVADNGSPEGPDEVRRVVRDRAKLVFVAERGAAAARNGGVAAASGAILAFTDSDCRPRPDWLEEGLRALGRCDIVGGAVDVLVDNPERLSAVEAFEKVFAFRNEHYVTAKGFTVTANLICAREVFRAAGEFSTSGVSEDVEWCARARACGYRLAYAADAAVGHPARRSWPDLVKKTRRINRESYLLALKTAGGRRKWLFHTLATPFSALAHTPRALFSSDLTNLGERFGALAVLWRLRIWRTLDYAGLLTADLATGANGSTAIREPQFSLGSSSPFGAR